MLVMCFIMKKYFLHCLKKKLGSVAKGILDKYPDIKRKELHKLDNLSDEDRENKKDYLSIMNENLELIKQELYQ